MFAGGPHFRRSLGLALALTLTYTSEAIAQESDNAGVEDAPSTSTPDPASPEVRDDSRDNTKPSSGKSKTSKGRSYGGRSTGPSPLPLLPADPAYPVAKPPVNEALPVEVDAVPPWQPNVVCDPVDRPGTEAFATLIGSTYDRPDYSSSRSCINQKSDHHDGRAIDWSLDAGDPADRRIADAAVIWLSDNDGEMAKRFGIQSIIWNAHTWKPDGKGWQGYAGQSAHTDHVHFSLTWDGAMMRTSWWTGMALEEVDLGPCAVVGGQYAAIPTGVRTEPCSGSVVAAPDSGYTSVRPGGSGPGVGLVQPMLDVKSSGVLDYATVNALLQWQDEQGIPTTGVLDQLTYTAALGRDVPDIRKDAFAVTPPDYLTTDYSPYKRVVLEEGSKGAAVEVLQRGLDLEDDGIFGPATAKALLDFSTEEPLLSPTESTTTLVWHLLEQRDQPTLPYRQLTAEVGDEGSVVKAAQQLLGVKADGVFGPNTEAAVREAQAEADVPVSGIIDGPTWAALDVGEVPASAIEDLRGGHVDPSTVLD